MTEIPENKLVDPGFMLSILLINPSLLPIRFNTRKGTITSASRISIAWTASVHTTAKNPPIKV